MSQEEKDSSVEAFKNLNGEIQNKFFSDTNFILEEKTQKMTERQFQENINKILKPDINSKKGIFTTDNEYIPKTTDPYKRILQIKIELIKNQSDIEKAMEKFNNTPSKKNDKDIGGYSNLFSNVHNSKIKIDAFINYDLFEKKNESDSDSESDESDSEKSGSENSENSNSEKSEGSNDSKEGSKKSENFEGGGGKEKDFQKEEDEKVRKNIEKEIEKKREKRKEKNTEDEERRRQDEEEEKEIFRESEDLRSIYEKYDRLSQNLLSKLKSIDDDPRLNIKYKICSNPESKLDILTSKLVDLDYLISKLEKTIGNWDMSTQHESICMTINSLLSFLADPERERFDKKYESFKAFGNMIEKNKLNVEQKEIAFSYMKIRESYLVLQTMKKFVDVVSYIRKRINSIKKIVFTSEQFNTDINELKERIKKNEVNYGLLKFKYYQTLESFSCLEQILKSLNDLDVLVRQKA